MFLKTYAFSLILLAIFSCTGVWSITCRFPTKCDPENTYLPQCAKNQVYKMVPCECKYYCQTVLGPNDNCVIRTSPRQILRANCDEIDYFCYKGKCKRYQDVDTGYSQIRARSAAAAV